MILYICLGYSLHKLEKFEDAIAAYDKAIKINPNKGLYYFNKIKAMSDDSKLWIVLSSNKGYDATFPCFGFMVLHSFI